MPGALRVPCRSPCGPPSWTASALGGEWPRSASWQLAHDCWPDADSDASAKIFSPSAASAESAASAGAGESSRVPPPPHAARPASTASMTAASAPLGTRPGCTRSVFSSLIDGLGLGRPRRGTRSLDVNRNGSQYQYRVLRQVNFYNRQPLAPPRLTAAMLDISLLRKDLPQVVARLETRKSPQPFLDLARFAALEAERKALQTRTEELQARRNALSREIGKLKAQGGDASAAMSRGRRHRRRARSLGRAAGADPARAQRAADGAAQPSRPERSGRRRRARQRRGAALGHAAPVRLRAARPRRRRRAARARSRDRRQALGRALLVPARPGGAPASRARPVHARRADQRARLHRVLHAVHRQPRGPRGHRPAAQVQERHVLGLPRRRGRRRRGRRRASST